MLTDHCHACLARSSGLCQALSDDELSILERYRTQLHSYAKGDHIYHEGDHLEEMFSLTRGWVTLYHVQPDGERQIVEVLLPGAFFGFQPNLQGATTHSASCLTDAEVCGFSRVRMIELFREHPNVALRAFRMCSRDRIRMHSHIADLGRSTARERIGRMLLRLHDLSALRERSSAPKYLPLRQLDISDILGLTPVHTNRVIRALREEGLIETHRGGVRIIDAERLAEAVDAPDPDLDED